jgi:SAM-dependent methyltransferase
MPHVSSLEREPRCRFCEDRLTHTFVDLGVSPLANSYLSASDLNREERFFPLHVFVCDACLLVQLEEFENPENIFSDYAYFSSYSESWLRHARAFVEETAVRLRLGPDSLVLELASNDGYLLQYFVEKGIPVLGVEPARNVAEAAREKGIETITEFFGRRLAGRLIEEGRRPDLLVGNNVLAHVPALNDFVSGMARVLKPSGVISLEFPHLMRLIEENQFDTIYHEHFSYFSLLAAEKVFAAHGLRIFDVEELPTHGGSLRIFACHVADARATTGNVEDLRRSEIDSALHRAEGYEAFQQRVRHTKRRLLRFLIEAKEEGKSIAAYAAAAKGNTLLNYCGIRTDFVDYVVDRSPHKQGRYLPGSHIPILPPERLEETRPDYVLILAWNLKDEIMESMANVRSWGGKFVTPIPEVTVHA